MKKIDSYKELLENINDTVTVANTLLSTSPLDKSEYSNTIKRLKKLENAYTSYVTKEVYRIYSAMDNPIENFIRLYNIKTIGHFVNEKTDDHGYRLKRIELCEKSIRINLKSFCKKAHLSINWLNDADNFSQLVCLRKAKSLKLDYETIATTQYMRMITRKIKSKETPLSNTQVRKLLQILVNKILSTSDEKGNHLYKVYNWHVKYYEELYFKNSFKRHLVLKISSDKYLNSVLVDIMYQLLTGKHIDITKSEHIEQIVITEEVRQLTYNPYPLSPIKPVSSNINKEYI